MKSTRKVRKCDGCCVSALCITRADNRFFRVIRCLTCRKAFLFFEHKAWLHEWIQKDTLNFSCKKIHVDITLCASCKKKFKSFYFHADKELWAVLTDALDLDLEHTMKGHARTLNFARLVDSIRRRSDKRDDGKGVTVPQWEKLVSFSKKYVKPMRLQKRKKKQCQSSDSQRRRSVIGATTVRCAWQPHSKKLLNG